MVELEIFIVLVLNTVIAGVACIPFGVACRTQKYLRPLLFTYIFLAIGCLLSIFQFESYTIRLIANSFFAIAAIFLFIAVFLDYYKIFIKPYHKNITIQDKIAAALTITPIIIGFEIFIITLVSISVIMLFRIYLKTHSPTRLFMLINAISAIICEIALYVRIYDIEGAYFFSNIIVTFFVTLMLSMGFVALLEQKNIDTLKEKNALKDKYSHDLGNILHTISISYDLINMEQPSATKSDELDNLIKDKVNEASKLVKSIRKL